MVDGSLHVGIGGYTRRIAGITHIPLLKERQRLHCATGHPLFGLREDEINIDQISKWECVKRPYVPDVEIPDSARFQATALAENMEAIAFLILSGRFIEFLPEHYAARWVEFGQMQAVLPDRMHYDSHIELLVRSSAPQSLGVRLFVADLLAAFRCQGTKAEAVTADPSGIKAPKPRGRKGQRRPN